jgi:hypothetical protein
MVAPLSDCLRQENLFTDVAHGLDENKADEVPLAKTPMHLEIASGRP